MAAAAAAGLESPGAYSESLGDQDDVVYPCKGCGEILEEGKAFELAGNRWHIDCFRCNTCNTLLDSDANLLLLGDGSLICNNCTYSCNACGNKIEDLAILTGDQAFCASCFRCRNCKRKIENLRYARTSQGIFCMSCHETLTARRRKRAKGSSRPAQSGASGTQEKALPSLPPGIDSAAFSPETETPLSNYSETKSPPERHDRQLGNSPATFDNRTASPHLDDGRKDAQTLPSSTYGDGRSSNANEDTTDGAESGYLPMAFDPNPARPPVNPSVSRKQVPRTQDSTPPTQNDNRDYFGKAGNKRETDSTEKDTPQDKAGKLSESATPTASPHVGASSSRKNSTADAFKLHEAPKTRKPGTRGSPNTGDVASPIVDSLKNERLDRDTASTSPASVSSQHSGVNPFDDPKRKDDRPAPARVESLAAQNTPKADGSTPIIGSSSRHDRKASTASFSEGLPRTDSRAKVDEAGRSSVDGPPPRNASRPSAGKTTTNGDFVQPRAPPQPPSVTSHKQQESVDGGSVSEDHDSTRNSGLPKHNVDGPFNMEEEMARILRGDNHSRRDTAQERTEFGMLRRVSNAVKHGRSFSDRVSNTGSKSPNNGSQIEISSPITAVGGSSISSPTSQTALDQLRAQLKRAHLRIAELEADKNGLQEKFDSSAHISAASKELSDKRNTMVVLDAQREMVVAELESMTKNLKRAKDSNKPLDLNLLKSDVLRDFTDEMQKVKDRTSTEIEKLMLERNALTDEIGQLIQMKDKGFQEYESVSSKNAQLLELNAQLVHNIQEMYKAGAQAKGSTKDVTAATGGANGLGIYGSRPAPDTPAPQTDHAEPAAMVSAPQVVDIRKGNAKKFNWRKGGEKVAKNVTRGIKGMLAGEQVPSRDGPSPSGDIGTPYHMMQAAGGSERDSAAGSRPDMSKNASNNFGIFSQKNGSLKPGAGNKDSSTNLAADASVLFGSELEARCEFEKRVVPSIVSRCIEEVELRGMTLEGIYRKSGGSSQVKTVQSGFEKDGNYDISDDDLDIHAVTSTLKQYLRKLPTPLITFDAYDSILDAGQIQDKEKQAAALRVAVGELPDAHRSCLEYLFQHLGRVVQHESDNLMTPLNVSVVFAPTIMRPLSIEREMSDMQAQRIAVQALLEHQRTIFGE